MKTTVALIGAGNWGKNHARALANMPDVELRVIVDPAEAARTRAARLVPGAVITGMPEHVFDDEEIEAVVIATPAPTHAALTVAALKAKKHVLVEKPLCLSTGEIDVLRGAAAKSDQILMVGHLLEYHPAVDKLRTLINDGELGKIRYIYSARVNLGIVRRDENAWWSLAPHDISVLCYLLGEEPLHVSAHGACYLSDGVEDVVFANLQFSGNVMAQVHVSWLDPHKIRKFTVVGERKMVTFDDMEPAAKLWIYDKGADPATDYDSVSELIALRQGDVLIPLVENAEPLLVELNHFVECIQREQVPRTDFEDGARVVRVLEAGQRSLESGGATVSVREKE